MIKVVKGQKTTESFIAKYKKWIIALVGIQLIPTILVISTVIVSVIYHYANNDTHFHPYKSYIISGFKVGFKDGEKDHNSDKSFRIREILPSTIWDNYDFETEEMQKRLLQEKEDYLAQFPESEKSIKRAEIKLNNIKLPLQIEVEKRFTSGLQFYAHYIDQKVKREKYNSDIEYNNALDDEAWKVGYAEGYRQGKMGKNWVWIKDYLR